MQSKRSKRNYHSGKSRKLPESVSTSIDSRYSDGLPPNLRMSSSDTTLLKIGIPKSIATVVSGESANLRTNSRVPHSKSSSSRHRIELALRVAKRFSNTRITLRDLHHLSSRSRAVNSRAVIPEMSSMSSSAIDEFFFLSTVRTHGLKRAVFLAAIFQLKYQRPLRALLSMFRECGRSYTTRSRAPRRTEGSPASSRSRGKGA